MVARFHLKEPCGKDMYIFGRLEIKTFSPGPGLWVGWNTSALERCQVLAEFVSSSITIISSSSLLWAPAQIMRLVRDWVYRQCPRLKEGVIFSVPA
jgi:hypothetical protein